MKIAFLGLGKLGLPIAETMAEAGGHDVWGFDVAPRRSGKITICASLPEVVHGKDLIFIAVETPHLPAYDGSRSVRGLPVADFDYRTLESCLRDLAPSIPDGQPVVVISTVLPGTCRSRLQRAIPQARLIYNPYLIAMGTEREDFLDPEMVLIGSEDGSGTAELELFYGATLGKQPRFVSGTWEEIEAAKIFYNTFISMKLSLVNMIQDVSERIGHMNTDVVTEALAGAQRRIISSAYMKAGMGDGGPCHPRDNIALRWLSQELELGYDLFDAVVTSREGQARNLARFLREQSPRLTILGKTYKPGVNLTAGSYSLLVAEAFRELGGEVEIFEPATGDTALVFEGPRVYLISYWAPWVEEFVFAPGSTVVDPWRRMAPRSGLELVHYGNTRARAPGAR